MTKTVETFHALPPGFLSERAALMMWQMDEQRRGLVADTRGLTPELLEWQHAPGMNSIGMLLAHIAYAEAHLVQIGVRGEPVGHAQDVVGITEEEEGLPLAPDAPPSPALRGKDLAFYDGMLERARAETRRAAAVLTDADLERKVFRARPDGTQRVFDVGWVLYHILEHEAGHRAQVNLMKHLYRLARG
jgi:uncharacterized damage-inducible protein DinB